jgi:hypothetical protein
VQDLVFSHVNYWTMGYEKGQFVWILITSKKKPRSIMASRLVSSKTTKELLRNSF